MAALCKLLGASYPPQHLDAGATMTDFDIEQANVRVPAGTSDVIRDLARLMRKNPSFAHRVRRLILEEEDPATGALLSQRIDKLEAQVRAILSGSAAGIDPPAIERAPGGTKWTIGEGRGRRLTPNGEEELRRLVAEGHSDAQIADRLGVKPFTVKARRRT